MVCSGSISLAVTVTRGGLTGVVLVADVSLVAASFAGLGWPSPALLRGSWKKRPPARLNRGSFTDGKTFSDSIGFSLI